MNQVIKVNERGVVTLPKEVRKTLGVTRGGQLLLETEKNGSVTLRAGVVMPVEMYSEQRVAEFRRMNEGPLTGEKRRWRKTP